MHVCFVALHAYNLFADAEDVTHVGGAETQQFILARWLADNGHQVSVVTLDHGQPDTLDANGIRLVRSYALEAGLPVLRFLTPRWTGLAGALARADADIYYQRGAGVETGQVALWCRWRGKPFVYGIASDADCRESLPFLEKARDRVLFRAGIRRADAVIAQSETQARLVDENHGRPASVFRNVGRVLGAPVPLGEKEARVVWVGRLSPEKRFEWVIEIARRAAAYTFDVVGNPNRDSAYARELLAAAQAVENVEISGHVPPTEIVRHYQRARVLLLTSPLEGFPNVFLEAWQLGVPVVTTFDPDGLVAEHGLGWHVDSVEAAVDVLDRILAEPALLAAASERCARYFAESHLPDRAMPRFVKILETALTKS